MDPYERILGELRERCREGATLRELIELHKEHMVESAVARALQTAIAEGEVLPYEGKFYARRHCMPRETGLGHAHTWEVVHHCRPRWLASYAHEIRMGPRPQLWACAECGRTLWSAGRPAAWGWL